jgi:hypothetical protein
MTEVYINGQRVDLEEDETITASYGNIAFGEFNKKKGIKSNNYKLPITNKNKLILENPDIVNNASALPYTFLETYKLVEGEKVVEGLASVEECEEYYEVVDMGGVSEFYNHISSRKLAELDFSEYDHVWSQSGVMNSWTNTHGYIYAYVNYYPPLWNRVMAEYHLPHLFFHTIVKKIVAAAGYTIKGKVLQDTTFLNHLITYNRFPRLIVFEELVSLTNVVPDVTQSKIILDFLNMYGLMPSIDKDAMIITFDYIDDIIFKAPIDWSNKIDNSSKVLVEYDFGLAQKNTLSYKTDDTLTDGKEYEVLVDNPSLSKESNIYISDAFIVEETQAYENKGIILKGTFKGFDVYKNTRIYSLDYPVYHKGSYYTALIINGPSTLDGVKEPGVSPTHWKKRTEAELFTYKSRFMYGLLTTNPSSTYYMVTNSGEVQLTKLITSEGLDWEIIYDRRYRLFDRLLDKTKVIELSIKLNYADVNQLDFTRPYWFDRYNNLFVLEEVRQYKLNESDSTTCRFIKIGNPNT